MAYSPVVGRLDCGSFKDNPKGFWQLNGFGVMAVYKSDWDRFKGKSNSRYRDIFINLCIYREPNLNSSPLLLIGLSEQRKR